MDEFDSLAYSAENGEEFVLNCPWMLVVKKDACYNTEFEVPVNAVDIDFDLMMDDEEYSHFNPFAKLPTNDFIKKCNFKYNPGKMFNLVVQYE